MNDLDVLKMTDMRDRYTDPCHRRAEKHLYIELENQKPIGKFTLVTDFHSGSHSKEYEAVTTGTVIKVSVALAVDDLKRDASPAVLAD